MDSRKIAGVVAQVAPPARKIGDIVIVVGWAIWTWGLALAVPAMLREYALVTGTERR